MEKKEYIKPEGSLDTSQILQELAEIKMSEGSGGLYRVDTDNLTYEDLEFYLMLKLNKIKRGDYEKYLHSVKTRGTDTNSYFFAVDFLAQKITNYFFLT